MTLSRRLNWDVELVLFARSVLGKPFAWGSTDCGSLVWGLFAALYGRDAAEEALGAPWDGVRAAREAVGRLRPVAEVLGALGAARIEPSYARNGDVVVWRDELDELGLPRFAILAGGRVIGSTSELGVFELKTEGVVFGAVDVWRLPA